MKFTSFLTTTLIVGTISVIATILFAPSKGENTRRKLARKGREYKDYVVDGFHDFTDSVAHTFETVEDEATRLSRVAEDKAKKMKSAFNEKSSFNEKSAFNEK